ncbi:MAG TPA: hypothetical protein PJ982_16280, partial [Lacipirellulaceae bacterium]|nr:hypothetical protein [Lacipirellulaceae bacterium]
MLLLRFQLFDPVDSRAATIDRDANVALVYARDNEEIPNVPVRVVLAPGGGDDGARIQAALEHVASLPADAGGFRGAVLLRPGRYLVAGQLRLTASGVVLRGSGAGPRGTVIVAAGRDRRPLIRI